MKTNYDEQAAEFLEKTQTTFKAVFLKYGKHFDDDEEARDIYTITLARGGRSWSFQFGNSLNNTQKRMEACMSSGYQAKAEATTAAHKRFGPSAYDVLAAISKSDPGTFENFCGEYGYDTDSRNAERTYRAVVDEWQHVCMLFSDAEIEKLQEIQ